MTVKKYNIEKKIIDVTIVIVRYFSFFSIEDIFEIILLKVLCYFFYIFYQDFAIF